MFKISKVSTILYLKRVILVIIRLILRFLWIFPIDNKSILFISYSGKQYSCSPKYISEYINKNYKEEYSLTWVVTQKSEFMFLKDRGYTIVKFNSLNYIFKVMTAKAIVTNISLSNYIPLRKNQYIVNTWHGGGAYKKSLFNEDKIKGSAKSVYADKFNLYLSSCKRFSDLVIRDTFGYDGEILDCGLPRNDIFFSNHDRLKKHVKEYYKIDNNTRILLFAPTYRDINLNVDFHFEYKKVLEALNIRFGGKWVLCVRTHQAMIQRFPFIIDNKEIIDVSNYPDMQELLYTADVLITDYSSSIWDFSLMKKPCFLYSTDLASYKLERNFYIDIRDWHFPLCQNSKELVDSIKNFNEEEFRKNMELHHKEWGSYEDGNATRTAVEKIRSSISTIEKCQIVGEKQHENK